MNPNFSKAAFVLILASIFSLFMGNTAWSQVTGCTDPNACNYDSSATIDSGSCCYDCLSITITGGMFPEEVSWIVYDPYESIVGAGVGGGTHSLGCALDGCFQLHMFDSFGDGWNDATYTVLHNENVLASGTLPFGGEGTTSFSINLIPGCLDPAACNYDASAECSGLCSYPGCTDPAACNFQYSAGCDDGSCAYVTGCMDAAACNYNPNATCPNTFCDYSCDNCSDETACNFNPETIDDLSGCCYANCLTFEMYDSFGDGWNGAWYTILDSDGVQVASGTLTAGSFEEHQICLVSGCYQLLVTGGSFGSEVSWSLNGIIGQPLMGTGGGSLSFQAGIDSPCGCTDPEACNYSEYAVIDNGSCLYGNACWGCLDPDALNYSVYALWENNTCVYGSTSLIFFDSNGDGLPGAFEPGLSTWAVYVEELGATFYSNSAGYLYLENLTPGNYTLTVLYDDQAWQPSTSTTQTIQVPGNGILGQFGFAPYGAVALLEISGFADPSVLHCTDGQDLGVWIHNVGASIISGEVSLTHDPSLTAVASGTGPDPNSFSAGVVSWQIEGLAPNASQFFVVHFNGPGVDFLADEFTFLTEISYTADGVTYYEVGNQETHVVACAYDPNDKTGYPAGYAEPNYIASGEPIEYVIRFQNTGNYPATDIIIRDQLDLDVLDISTFTPLYATHSYFTCLDSEGMLEFIFDNIYLPDSVNNEPESHGMVRFSINTFNDLPHNTAVENSAAIYFDANPPVLTNTTLHTIFSCDSFSGITGQTEYCEGSQIELHTDDQYVETYTWYLNGEPWGNSDLLMIPSFPAMDYLISLELSNPLCNYTDEVMVTVSPSPPVMAGEDVTICEGETAEISAVSDYAVAWNNGAGNGNQVNVSPEISTLYTATSVNEYGCSGFDQQWVLVTGLPDNTVSENNGWLTASDADSYQWFLNGSPIDGANDQSLFVEESGYYSVVITNGTDCSVTSEEVFVVSVRELQKTDFTVYPNPAQDGIRLDVPIGTWNYFICDNLGRTVSSGLYNRGEIIETSMLVSGCYSVVVTGDNSLLSASFLITR